MSNPMKASRAFWWVLGTFALLVLAAAPAIWVFVPAWYTRLAGTETQGVVYLVRDCGSDDNGDETYQETILFRDAQGQLQESTSGDDCTSDFANGDTATLWYLPTLPGNAFVDGGPAISFSVISVLYLAGGLLCLGVFLYFALALINACLRAEAFARLGMAALAGLLMLAPLLVFAHFFPPPALQGSNGPTHNYQAGALVSVEGQWAITVRGAQLAQVGRTGAPEAADTVCLELDITVRDTASQPLSLEVSQFALYDGQARVINPSCPVDVPKLANAHLAPGEIMQGALAFRVPTSLRQCFLAFRPDAPEKNVGRFFWRLEVR